MFVYAGGREPQIMNHQCNSFYLYLNNLVDLKFCHLDLSLCHAGEGWRALLWQKHSPTTLREEN